MPAARPLLTCLSLCDQATLAPAGKLATHPKSFRSIVGISSFSQYKYVMVIKCLEYHLLQGRTMLSTTEELRPQEAEAMTIQQLTKELLFMKKQCNTMHNAVQSLSSQVLRLDRDVRALSQQKNGHY
jgi:hypothetical protein